MYEQSSDQEVERTVGDELRWSPDLVSDLIAVTVQDGAVTLSGQVASAAEQQRAERAAAGVRGVRTVNLDLRVGRLWDDDADIAHEAIVSLGQAVAVPDSVHVTSDQHVLTLSGDVQWEHEREAADRAVRHGSGVRSVVNDIELTPL